MSPFTEKRFSRLKVVSPEEKGVLTEKITCLLLEKTEVVFAYLHGSFIISESFHDIDIGIFLKNENGFLYESDISYELSGMTGYDIEVRILNNAPVAFQLAVLKNGKLLFSKDEKIRTDFIENVGKRYLEYSHFRNIFMEALGAEH